MINEKRVLCVVPARGGSKGLPRKNIMDLCGRPLLGWPVQAAKASKYVDRVIVSTDDEEIARIAGEQGAEIPFIRPSELASDEAKSIEVIEHALNSLRNEGEHYDYLLLLEPTSPLTEAKDVDRALEMLESTRQIADSIVGVCKVEAVHPSYLVEINAGGLIAPYTAELNSEVLRRQDICDLYFFEGSLYISDVAVLLKKRGFYHERTLPYIVPRWKSLEVDEIQDIVCIEAIMKNRAIIERSQGVGQ